MSQPNAFRCDASPSERSTPRFSGTPRRHKSRSGGFTIIELMITIVILAIASAFAFPSLRQFLVRNNFESTVLDMRGAIARARAEAIARGNVVSIAPRTGTDWGTGYRVFSDPLQKGVFDAADVLGTGTDSRRATELVLGDPPSSGLDLTWPARNSDNSANAATVFLFDARGRPVTATNATGNASLPLCVPSKYLATNNCREIVVDILGRVRVSAYTSVI